MLFLLLLIDIDDNRSTLFSVEFPASGVTFNSVLTFPSAYSLRSLNQNNSPMLPIEGPELTLIHCLIDIWESPPLEDGHPPLLH